VKSDDGAGTILAISILIVFFALFAASSLVSTQLLGFTRLQATTNSIALAAADAWLQLTHLEVYPQVIRVLWLKILLAIAR